MLKPILSTTLFLNEIFIALVAGLIVGFIFTFLRLPIPAPPVLSEIMGIIGIFLGYKAFQLLIPLITK
ncbi:XapX domain-containing protein [Anaerobacillus alkaliphilus]|uniref:XapX domain-containing protein n=1 Tax=Anaerobacillus alkaliphilus TaxID=1548597 RepID=UPI0030C8827F